MARSRAPARAGPLRRTAAVLTSLSAVIATTVVTGPAVAVGPGGPCALERTGAHHSEGLDTWNPEYPRPLGTLDAAMIFLSFPDAHPTLTPTALAADHFPGTAQFFARASYGKFELRVHPMRRWLVMPAPSTTYAIQRDWESDRRAAYLRDALATADPAVDFGRYDLVYLVADPGAPGVDADATKVVNLDRPLTVDGTKLRRLVTVFEQHPPDHNVLAHETGHVFDLPDLYHRPSDGKGDWDTHVGDWDLMGSQFGMAPEPFGWHKWKLGWLGGREVVCVHRPGTTLHTLDPLGAPRAPGAPGHPRVVVVRTGPESALVIEARGAYGNDAGTCSEGVLIYRVRSGTASAEGPVKVIDGHPDAGACESASVYPDLADAPLDVGESYAAPEDGVRVSVEDATVADAYTEGGPEGRGATWTVKVTHDPVG
ncbi:M6 family metalloprotease domain-containing protein [Streptomyces buecherae]|uniref:M6 family metalloprotease domain-containing protein n=1 Tax=Streptomyces buecherae TaxID=2763006 RepID=UPI0027DF1ABB|nr:M6 family metalloprotease domain-containing protein [Streptomyces buecherae]